VLGGLALAENQDFDSCKQAILKYYRLDATTYKKRFREALKGAEESYKMFKTHIHDYLLYYIDARSTDSLDGMTDDAVCEQLLSVMSDEVRQFVVSKQVKTADERCEFADLFSEMNAAASATAEANHKPMLGGGGQAVPGVAEGQPRNNNGLPVGGSGRGLQ